MHGYESSRHDEVTLYSLQQLCLYSTRIWLSVFLRKYEVGLYIQTAAFQTGLGFAFTTRIRSLLAPNPTADPLSK